MFIGFDYGTSNCAVAVMGTGQPQAADPLRFPLPPSTCTPRTGMPSPACWPEGLAPAQQAEYSSCAAPW